MRPFLYLLALGAFTVGMEGLMIAGLLPAIADHLGLGLSTAGWLVVGFSATYAVTAPLAAALSASFERRRVLVLGLAVFALGNLACAIAPDFASLVAARLVTAVAAGLYMPAAMAYAGAAVPAKDRGRALGLVGGGITASLVLGVPLGTWIGTVGGWRWPFVAVAALAAVAIAGILIGVPRRPGVPGASVVARLSVLRRGPIREILATTVLWSSGAFAVYTFIAPVMAHSAGIGPVQMPALMLAWGVAACLGSVVGGRVVDRFGARSVAGWGLTVSALALAGLAFVEDMPVLAVGLTMVWGVAGWAVNPAQQTRLIMAEPALAQISLSLQASGIYLGSALGSLFGSLVVAAGLSPRLGLLGALCEFAALLLLLRTRRRATLPLEAVGTALAPSRARS
ncbi:MFS transporter [Arenibaculum pallidiluteum]|uniref:MFS transporter n=1 Tax=Arenibaculum pallidiluteum TaxID=2812559 RepID=UPI001A97AC75|nr:MFS transporter [Arenibaculum pallidiluteum]